MGNHILVSDGGRYPVEEYRKLTNEVTVPHSTAKHSSYKGRPFMVGALARVLLNKRKLKGRAAEMLKELEPKLDAFNPLTNNLAQAIETVYAVERAVEVIDELLDKGLKQDVEVKVRPRRGVGVSAVEAPRGVLYHCYELDDEGRVAKADIITPTAQNAANMEKYIKVSAERLLSMGEERLEGPLELLVRAYDPCISCSAHLIKVIKIR
jgi:sulfhydrogenase subunit alpha